jgi:hypothetical protein
MENLPQMTARLPEDGFPPPFGYKHHRNFARRLYFLRRQRFRGRFARRQFRIGLGGAVALQSFH